MISKERTCRKKLIELVLNSIWAGFFCFLFFCKPGNPASEPASCQLSSVPQDFSFCLCRGGTPLLIIWWSQHDTCLISHKFVHGTLTLANWPVFQKQVLVLHLMNMDAIFYQLQINLVLFEDAFLFLGVRASAATAPSHWCFWSVTSFLTVSGETWCKPKGRVWCEL